MKLFQSNIDRLTRSTSWFKTVFLITVWLCSAHTLVFAKESSESNVPEPKVSLAEKKTLEKSLKTYFDDKVTDLDETLFNNQQQLASDKKALIQFVDEKLLPLWSSTKTLKLMVGKKLWKTFSRGQKAQLEESFKQTFHRYVKEGMKHYDGQRIKVSSIRLRKKLKSGFLTAELEPIYLPKFNITFRITNTEDQWRFYDILIEGVGYIKIKRTEYRQILHNKGFDALICHLDTKNLESDHRSKSTPSLAASCKNPNVSLGSRS